MRIVFKTGTGRGIHIYIQRAHVALTRRTVGISRDSPAQRGGDRRRFCESSFLRGERERDRSAFLRGERDRERSARRSREDSLRFPCFLPGSDTATAWRKR